MARRTKNQGGADLGARRVARHLGAERLRKLELSRSYQRKFPQPRHVHVVLEPEGSRKPTDAAIAPAPSELPESILHVFALAVKVFGDVDAAKVWLQRPHPGLGDRSPLSIVASGASTAAIEQQLHAIDHGIF